MIYVYFGNIHILIDLNYLILINEYFLDSKYIFNNKINKINQIIIGYN